MAALADEETVAAIAMNFRYQPRAGMGVIAATWLFMDLASLDEMCED